MYIFLGSCKDVPMGPTAITSLLTYQTLYAYTSDGLGPEYGTLLCFLCGVVQFFMGLAGLGEYYRIRLYVLQRLDKFLLVNIFRSKHNVTADSERYAKNNSAFLTRKKIISVVS